MRIHTVVFDMDQTLVDSHIDYEVIRKELSIDRSIGILEAIEAMDESEKPSVRKKLAQMELDFAKTARPFKDTQPLLHFLQNVIGIRTALLTRNCVEVMNWSLEQFGWKFDYTAARDSKPDPSGLIRALEHLGSAPSNTMMVGDSWHDVEAANAAGVISVLLDREEMRSKEPLDKLPQWFSEAKYVFHDLTELLKFLEDNLAS